MDIPVLVGAGADARQDEAIIEAFRACSSLKERVQVGGASRREERVERGGKTGSGGRCAGSLAGPRGQFRAGDYGLELSGH